MNILVIDSSKNTKSFTRKISNIILSNISEVVENITITTIKISEMNIIECAGCRECFKTGQCFLDSKDDIKKIKKELLKADVIFITSPIYLNFVSSGLKKMLERLSSWTHLMKLKNKFGIILITTDFTGVDIGINYVNMISEYLGIKIIGKFGVIRSELNVADFNKKSLIFAYHLNELIQSQKVNKYSNDSLNKIFLFLKNYFQNKNGFKNEIQYWENIHSENFTEFCLENIYQEDTLL